jgi:uncharacterized membrane protein
MKFIKRNFGYLFSGLIIWLPVAVLIVIVKFILDIVESTGHSIIAIFVPDKFIYSGLGILLGIVLCYITGIILRRTKVGDFFAKIPVLGILLGSRKGKSLSLEILTKLTPCLFLLSPTCISPGWIISEEKVKVKEEYVSFQLVNIYYPNVPTLVTGQVFSVRKETVMKIGNPSREMIDLLLYASRTPENIIYLPWENEEEEEFKERAKRFGIN